MQLPNSNIYKLAARGMAKQPPKERLLCPFNDYKRLLRQGYPTRGRRGDGSKQDAVGIVDKLAL